ncbi:hypothetical protein EDD36DRAFT_460560 [Exophiala viscosa]|uniref:Uncharacterized protein n=1 Tax=Exophiala viscosa TaxID=2486360 RepID=A0AAN6IIQ2_9EURO|nr:hypothetical protein EDD36DRAFT_460560 [Exophiala viscosa]
MAKTPTKQQTKYGKMFDIWDTAIHGTPDPDGEPPRGKDKETDHFPLFRYPEQEEWWNGTVEEIRDKIPKNVKLDDAMLLAVVKLCPSATRRKAWQADFDQSGNIRAGRTRVGPGPQVAYSAELWYPVFGRNYPMCGDDYQDTKDIPQDQLLGSKDGRFKARDDPSQLSVGLIKVPVGHRNIDTPITYNIPYDPEDSRTSVPAWERTHYQTHLERAREVIVEDVKQKCHPNPADLPPEDPNQNPAKRPQDTQDDNEEQQQPRKRTRQETQMIKEKEKATETPEKPGPRPKETKGHTKKKVSFKRQEWDAWVPPKEPEQIPAGESETAPEHEVRKTDTRSENSDKQTTEDAETIVDDDETASTGAEARTDREPTVAPELTRDSIKMPTYPIKYQYPGEGPISDEQKLARHQDALLRDDDTRKACKLGAEKYGISITEDDPAAGLWAAILEELRTVLPRHIQWFRWYKETQTQMHENSPIFQILRRIGQFASAHQTMGKITMAEELRKFGRDAATQLRARGRMTEEQAGEAYSSLLALEEDPETSKEKLIAEQKRGKQGYDPQWGQPTDRQLPSDGDWVMADRTDQDLRLLCLSRKARKFTLAKPDATFREKMAAWNAGTRLDEYGSPWRKPQLHQILLSFREGWRHGTQKLYGRYIFVRAERMNTDRPDARDRKRQIDIQAFYNDLGEPYSEDDEDKRLHAVDDYSDRHVLVREATIGAPDENEETMQTARGNFYTGDGLKWQRPAGPVKMSVGSHGRYVEMELNDRGDRDESEFKHLCQTGPWVDRKGNPVDSKGRPLRTPDKENENEAVIPEYQGGINQNNAEIADQAFHDDIQLMGTQGTPTPGSKTLKATTLGLTTPRPAMPKPAAPEPVTPKPTAGPLAETKTPVTTSTMRKRVFNPLIGAFETPRD